ncbi:hypothetical protein H0H93_006043, partial [Arthromyces matolae]
VVTSAHLTGHQTSRIYWITALPDACGFPLDVTRRHYTVDLVAGTVHVDYTFEVLDEPDLLMSDHIPYETFPESEEETGPPAALAYTSELIAEQEVEAESETDVNLRKEAHHCGLKIKLDLAKRKKAKDKSSGAAGPKSLKGTDQVSRKKRKYSEDQTKSHASDGVEEHDVPRRPRGRPPKPCPPVVPISTFSVAVYVEIAVLPVMQKGKTQRGNKMVKQDPKTCGPFTLTHATKWKPFLKDITNAANIDKENLPVDAMAWSMGQKRSTLPLTNKVGFEAMKQQIKAAKDPNSAHIIVSLPPISTRSTKKAKHRHAVSTSDGEAAVFEQEPVEDDGSAWGKKLTPVVEKLQGLYPVGDCDLHPTIRCFHYHKQHWHFELDSNRLNVWAAAIIKGETDYARAPLTSKFFSPKMRIKNEAPEQSEVVSTPRSIPAQAPTPWAMGAMNNYPFPFVPMPYSPMAPSNFFSFPTLPIANYATPTPSTPGPMWGPNNVNRLMTTPSTPNASTAHSNIMVEWGKKHGLGQEELDGLTKLGYRIGDDLTSLETSMWQEVGLGPLHRQRILRACTDNTG